MKRDDAEHVLRRALNDPNARFHTHQWEAIDHIVNRQGRLLLVQRTGWGKSIVYFIGTRALRDKGKGPTIIISPLLSLMRNQIITAERLGIRAQTINSANVEDWHAIEQRLLNDEVDALLISPERFGNEDFIERMFLPIAGRIGMLVIDEAHCISDWGHDFRPDYRRLVHILKRLPDNIPVLATTATANDRVVRDIEQQMGNIDIMRGSLLRESLILQTIRLPDQSSRLAWLAERVPRLSGTGIIYTLTRHDADCVSKWLRTQHIQAWHYYSDAYHEKYPDSDEYRNALEKAVLQNKVKAVVATSALGMGFDKPDVGFVIHYQAPGSVVSYYQQVGRAGRALPQAYGVLLSGEEDTEIHEYFLRTAFPDEDHIVQVLAVLGRNDGLTVDALQRSVNLSLPQVEKVLKLLQVENPAPLIHTEGKWYRTHADLHLDHERIAFLHSQRQREWEQMQRYIDHSGCFMQFLAKALDDDLTEPCGKCVNCRKGNALPTTYKQPIQIAATAFLQHSHIVLPPKVFVAKNLFPKSGLGGNLAMQGLNADTGKVLCRWGDAGWGRLVIDGKHENHFSDELVDAVVTMIRQWNPQPSPKWMTCVSSLKHPNLVPDFARRVAAQLNIPFVETVEKIRANEPQKMMQNRFHQCRNLDGAFNVKGKVSPDPLFLFDDLVDSGWTLTVVSALLRKAGAGMVFPVALGMTRSG